MNLKECEITQLKQLVKRAYRKWHLVWALIVGISIKICDQILREKYQEKMHRSRNLIRHIYLCGLDNRVMENKISCVLNCGFELRKSVCFSATK